MDILYIKLLLRAKNYFDLFIQDNYNGNPEIILSREYDPAINEGHNVSSGIPNGEMGMSRDCFEEYLCSNTGKPISLCGCHHPIWDIMQK